MNSYIPSIKMTTDIPKKIKHLMIDNNISGGRIAAALDVNPSMIWHTIHGRNRSFRVRVAIAKALGVPITDLWPDETRHLKKGL